MAEQSAVPPLPRRPSPGNAGHTTTLASPPPLRNRLLKNKTSFERTLPGLGLSRRRSSILSDFSLDDAHQSMRSSTGSVLLPKISEDHKEHDLHQEPSHWHSAPLVFALVPAVAGLFFKNGTAFATDVLLLGLAAIFLNWSVRLPWEMYRNAQATKIEMPMEDSGVIIEEDSEDESRQNSASPGEHEGVTHDGAGAERPRKLRDDAREKVAAKEELRQHELMALACCFLCPALGAYLLHTIRTQLSRPSEGLVSDYNLTIFLLAAEFRPAAHLIKLIQAQTLHLQRTLNTNPFGDDKIDSAQVSALGERVSELETHVSDLTSNHTALEKKSSDTTEVTGAVNKAMQPQLDALNRAVRRYEKRAMTQAIQTEARMQDLEKRLKDALSLAAAAAENGRRPGFTLSFLESVSTLFMLPVQALWTVSAYPLQAVTNAASRMKIFLIGPRPSKKKRIATKHEDHGALTNGRMAAKGGKR
ncbi:hypothetical protein EV356DRAFT_517936 [Viridothelium virens]|uniref:Uncharacterized protein n=1 Tax=Viridothelium virens TaxID=1048519 RepID=A0A6A6HMI3_VIRVR|nr:hypothetical protein EV356DRAFT_517936 [Viridothelium virens]